MIRLEDQQLVDAFDALDSGVVVLDRDQRVVCFNYWFASASGISSQEATGRSLDELFPTRPLVRLKTSIAEAFTLGSSALLTYMLNPDLLPLRTRAGRHPLPEPWPLNGPGEAPGQARAGQISGIGPDREPGPQPPLPPPSP